jgi:5-(carboxyamino)imidazole ribonucleotide synthase
MSYKIIVLDPTEDCPASRIADRQIVADFKDENAIISLSEQCDVITYEIELANSAALRRLELAEYPVRPAPETLRIIQNKFRQKSFLRDHGVKVTDFAPVRSEIALRELCKKFGVPLMLKACEDSYDGRGNYLVRSESAIPDAMRYFGGRETMAEAYVSFTKEISVMVARNPRGDIESFPVAENIHTNSILDTTLVPARISRKVELKAKKLAEKTMDALHGAGIFGIEMFVTRRDEVLLNEIAPRPHNSGHYTNEACSISQFEQHLRAVLDLPLGKPELLCPAAMVNILGPDGWGGQYAVSGLEAMSEVQGAKLYLYGKKTTKPRRKLGHITATGRTVEEALRRARRARTAIRIIRSGDGSN